jgi:hypothetical protein
MIRYPEVQRRMQQELDKVVDKDELICTSNKLELPYTNAVIMVSCLAAFKLIGIEF